MEIYGPYIIGSSISSIIGGISYYLFSDNSQETNVLQEIDNTDKIIKETNLDSPNILHEYSFIDKSLQEKYYYSDKYKKNLGISTTNKFENIIQILNNECNRKVKMPILNNKKQRQKIFRYIKDYESIGHFQFINKYKN